VTPAAAVRAAIPRDVADLLRALRTAGFGAYVVGGAVRDVIAGRVPADWDLATEATPDQLRALFPTATYENRFGTVGVPTDQGVVREITTFRADSGSGDGRRPDEVTFLPRIEGDLARRDFTINAIAFGLAPGASRRADPIADGAIVDPHGGIDDLANALLHAVGDPAERFIEDGLRMLRAIRFVARFNLTVEAGTAAAIKRDAPLAARLSGERIGAEIEGILAAAHPARALQLAADLGIFAAIAPALATEWNAEVGTRVEAVGGDTLPDAPDPLGRMSELLLPIADDDDVAALLESWRRPRATIAAIQQIRALDRAVAVAEGEATRGHLDGAALRIVAAATTGDPRDAARQIRRRVATGRASHAAAALLSACAQGDDQQLPAAASDLALAGDQLVARLGRTPGPWVAALLARLVDDVAHRRVANAEGDLLAWSERVVASEGRDSIA
jgi:tRNA nucleotidyltransferase (CCA-adding enzyme)